MWIFLDEQDGDLGTSWTCTGDPSEPNASGNIYYDCELTFGLVYYRNVKQVKIGETCPSRGR